MGGDLSCEQRACGSQWCCFRQLVWETKPGLRRHGGCTMAQTAAGVL